MNDGDSYAAHREHVMRLIEATAAELAAPGESARNPIALLGAGNCLDIDLVRLTEMFRGVHLIDVDETAVSRSIGRNSSPANAIAIHAPVDIAAPLLSLTPIDFEAAGERTGNDVTANHNFEHWQQVLQDLSANEADLGVASHSCDAVVSLCLLTQLIGSLTETASENHPLYASAVKAIRVGHLRRMLKLLRPGGVAILVTDIVSSETAPELADTPEEELGPLIKRLVNDRNFFTGVNPALVLSDLNMLERLPNGPDTAQVFDPWLWHMGPRVFAVYGIRFQAKRPPEAIGEESSDER